jgi:dTDP-4-dehydrorhamnose reductase
VRSATTAAETGTAPLEIWGGHECTINRVGETVIDQTALSGHDRRSEDIDRFAALGISALRFPILWERVTPNGVAPDWSFSDPRLTRLRQLKVRPIAGLIHHGSGPFDIDLLSGDFAAGLAAHAGRTARRYPWIQDWTPVNEPLTTARFSALYGYWYPHARDERAFWLALLNQIDAVRLSMTAIRSVIPEARLIQTDDVGRTYATKQMYGQAEFDNRRRWAGFDMLCGRLTKEHPLWDRLAALGFDDRLRLIADNPCPPDIIGINHYLTSDRFLDHRTARYPAGSVGRNAYGAFADVEAVRVLAPPQDGLASVISETWERYRLPLALTEIHNGCTREEQMRWLAEAWEIANAARAAGIDLRALSAWSLLGSYGWDRLLVEPGRSYECGIFDVRSGMPRPTAMVRLIRTLASGGKPAHPVLSTPGWWWRAQRLTYPPYRVVGRTRQHVSRRAGGNQPLVITGATGTLGRALAAACDARGIPYILTHRHRLSLTRPETIERLLAEFKPWAVINAAGWVRVDEAEADPQQCLAVNCDGAVALARACVRRGIHFTTFSSDLVFDGRANRPYIEGDEPRPLSVYGRSKSDADRDLLSFDGQVLVIRTAAFFSPYDSHNFAVQLIGALRRNHCMDAADCRVSPTYVPDLVRAVLDLVIDAERGLWHVVNDGDANWAEFGREIAASMGLPPALVRQAPACTMGWIAQRPAAVPLVTSRGQILPSLGDAIGRFAGAFKALN